MPAVHFTNLLIVVKAAFLAPLALGSFPRMRVPAIVLEILLGIIIGPSVLGWVTADLPVSILSLIGLAFLLFLAGLEIDVHRLRGAAGFRIFIPVFFVTTGLHFDVNALFASVATVALVPLFLLAILIVRGVPALLYRPLIGCQKALIADLVQATSLPFIVAATQIGIQIGVLTQASAAALIAAGLLSVIIFPAAGLSLLRRAASVRIRDAGIVKTPTAAMPVITTEDRALLPVAHVTSAAL